MLRQALLALIALAIVGGVVLAFLPEPVSVDLAEVSRGNLRVTVDDDGKTRIKERHIVSAPLAGRLRRITLDPGDPVDADSTVVAVIDPTEPMLLDARQQAEAEARVRAAEAAVSRSGAELEQAQANLDLIETELGRVRNAYERGGATQYELQTREFLFRQATERVHAAEFGQDIATYELDLANAALLRTLPSEDGEPATAPFEIPAPISGRVLRVFQESVAVVTPGTPLLEIGDPADLELVIDVLSIDAVQIDPGDRVLIEHWGGVRPLDAVVRLVEPSAFTKLSALGVEEQRVNVIADFVSPLEDRTTLGDGYRVEAQIVLWAAPDVLQVPLGALFRDGDDWAVYRVRDGRAELTHVRIGRRGGHAAELTEGLAPGDRVVLHPSDRVADGVKVQSR